MPEVEVLHAGLSPRREPPSELITPATKGRPASVTISQPVAEVFAFVRDFGNYAKFVRGLTEVEVLDAKIAELTFANESGIYVGQIEKVAEVRDQMISWKVLGDDSGNSIGAFTVEPAVGNRGTVVSLKMHFDDKGPPGKVKGMIAYFTGRDPKTESYINLRRLKAYLETGEVPTIQGQPSGRDQ